MNLQKLNGYLKDLKSSIEEDFENEEVILNYSPSLLPLGQFALGNEVIVDLKNIRCITCTLISNLELMDAPSFVIDQKAIKYFMNQIDYISDMFNCTSTGNVVHLAANKFDEISITLDWFRDLGIESLPNRIVEIDVKFQPPTKHVESFKNYNIYSR